MLELMSRLLGAPSERIWPGLRELPHADKYSIPAQPYNYLRKVCGGWLAGWLAGRLVYCLMCWRPGCLAGDVWFTSARPHCSFFRSSLISATRGWTCSTAC